MTTFTCPNGHASAAADYCDTCGVAIPPAVPDPATASPAASGTPGGDAVASPPAIAGPVPTLCPNCGTPHDPAALFCEACGYDFTTGTTPRPPDTATGPDSADDVGPVPDSLAPAIPVDWVAEVWVDPDWYEAQEAEDPCPSPGLPAVVELSAKSVLVGRPSTSRNIHPEVDCTGDSGVSRRQAQLTTDGRRWWVEDLQSSNGTYVGPASGPLPSDPIPPGQRRELSEDDRIYVGAWTRIVVRRATPEERAGRA